MRAARVISALSVVLGFARSVHAEPEWNVAAEASLCGRGERESVWKKTGFCGGFRGDLLFGRDRNADLGLGPYVSVGTATFSDLRLGGGMSLLLPTLGGDFPIVVSAGALTRNGNDLRLSSEAFFGLRSHNFHGGYAMASGIIIGGDAAFSGSRGNTLYVGLQIDGLWVALPFILGYEALRGTPDPGD